MMYILVGKKYMGNKLPYWRRRLFWILVMADLGPLRLMLAFGSILWSLLLPILYITSSSHAIILPAIFPLYIWCILFFIHGIGLLWRILSENYSMKLSVLVNTLGCTLWSGSLILDMISSNTFNEIDVGAELIIAFISIWVLARTVPRNDRTIDF